MELAEGYFVTLAILITFRVENGKKGKTTSDYSVWGIHVEGKIYNEPAEIRILNNHWLNFIKSIRLKMALALPAKVVGFLNSLEFHSCEDNTENVNLFYLYPFCDEIQYQYRYMVKCKETLHELEYYSAHNLWYLDKLRLKDRFSISENAERNIASYFSEFEPVMRLERIRIEILCEAYKRKYLHRQLTLKDIIIRDSEFYMVFEDGTYAKIVQIR